jgi:hypothetical protein
MHIHIWTDMCGCTHEFVDNLLWNYNYGYMAKLEIIMGL